MSIRTTYFIIFSLFCSIISVAQNSTTKQKTTTTKTTTTTKSGTKTEPQPIKIDVKNNSTTTTTNKNPANPNAKPFSFLGSFTMKYDIVDKFGKKSNGVVKYAYEGFRLAMIPSFIQGETQLRSIFDVKQNTMTMMITDVKRNTKKGMIMKMPKVTINNTSFEKPATAKITKTGEKKKIDGFNCESYTIFTSDSTIGEFWLTKDIAINASESLAYMIAGMKGKPVPMNTSGVDVAGCIIEADYKTKDGTTVHLKTSEIKKGKPDASFFSTDGYILNDVTQIDFFK
ncbi:MAG: hypothetical protein U0U67_09770 [Chitinophagales bacterium]